MFTTPPAEPFPVPLPPALLADDATAWDHAGTLQPVPVAAERTGHRAATVCAWVLGPALFVRALVREDLAPADREVVLDAVRRRIFGLLRCGTKDDGWRWDPAAEQWTATIDEVCVAVPDHVPAEWVRRAA